VPNALTTGFATGARNTYGVMRTIALALADTRSR
jgi:hypothetical protein